MPKLVDHEAYRVELIRASFDVVAKIGYGSLSMKQLAKSLNVSTGSIYHYFENKEDWFMAIVVHCSKQVFDLLTLEVRADAGLSEKCELLVAHIERHKELYANMVSVANDFVRMPKTDQPAGTLELGFATDQLYEHFAMLFETDEATACALVSYLVGIIMADRIDPRGVDVKEHLPFIRLLLQAPEAKQPQGKQA